MRNLFILRGLRCLIIIQLITIILPGCKAQSKSVLLASDKLARMTIVPADHPSASMRYASEELNRYLNKISDARFEIAENSQKPAIRLVRRSFENKETYRIEIKGKDILLSGGSDRAILYAVYDFLERLGCKWPAPDFEFYQSAAAAIPTKSTLRFSLSEAVVESPAFEYRKLDVAGSRTLAVDKLKKLIEWMPKGRYNTLRFRMDKETGKPVKWDKFREALTPELQKRGIIIEVGGHGYQHFMNASMENGTLFKQHPDWFGKDSACKASPSDRLVFNTENPEAVKYFTDKIVKYVKNRPEIAIFDFWPPDVGRWQDCPDFKKYGSPQDRQVKLANHVYDAIKKARPDIRMEIIAYSFALMPPEKTALNPAILLEICPINQSFEKQLYDTSASGHAEYVSAIKAWRKSFKGNITLYSYYRKQAWRSAANIIPHYMQKDMLWFGKIPLQGISCYAESDDWYTYELNHYVLGRLGWDPEVNVDSLSEALFKIRYGSQHQVAADAYALLEQTVRVYGSIPFSSLKTKEEIKAAQQKINRQVIAIQKAQKGTSISAEQMNFSRLLIMYGYVVRDFEIQYSRASGASKEKITQQIRDLVAFLKANNDKGVVTLTGSNDFGRFTKKYGLTHQSLLD